MISDKMQEFKRKFYKKDILRNYRLSSKRGLIILICLISVSFLMYLWQINGIATKGYQIKDLEEQASELQEIHKRLELAIAQLRSTERVNAEVEKLEMVAVARVEYLKSNGTSVAINR